MSLLTGITMIRMTVPVLAESTIGSILSLLFFFGLFLGILAWVMFGNRSGRFTRDANIPLDDGEPVSDRNASRTSESRKEPNHG